MPLTSDREVVLYATQELVDVPVDDAACIYKGALVGLNRATGLARPLVAGDDFLGLAYRRADNTGAGHAPGAVSVRLHQMVDIVHALSGVTAADVGREVYASDDSTLTLSPMGNSRVGRVVGVEKANVARVRLAPAAAAACWLGRADVVTLPDADVTLTLDHVNRVLLVPNTAARTITLPPVATVRPGGWIWVIKTTAAAFAVTLDGYASEQIEGSLTFTAIDSQFDTAWLMCTGSNWVILCRDIS
jgi:hypothetical protein